MLFTCSLHQHRDHSGTARDCQYCFQKYLIIRHQAQVGDTGIPAVNSWVYCSLVIRHQAQVGDRRIPEVTSWTHR